MRPDFVENGELVQGPWLYLFNAEFTARCSTPRFPARQKDHIDPGALISFQP